MEILTGELLEEKGPMAEIILSKIGRYKICKHKGKYYLIDTKFTNPVATLFTKLDKAKFEAILITGNLAQMLEKKNTKKTVSTLTTVLLVQPFVNISSRVGREIFQSLPKEYYLLIKLMYLAVVVFLTFAVFSLINTLDKKKMDKKLIENSDKGYKRFSLELREKSEEGFKPRNLIVTWITLVLLPLPLFIFFTSNNGTESMFPVIISLIIFGSCVFHRYLIEGYSHYEFIFSEAKDEEKALSNK